MAGNQGRWPKIDQDGGIGDVTLLILEWLGEQGVNAMIRVDADRAVDHSPAWTSPPVGVPWLLEVREESVPFLLGGGSILIAGPGGPAAGDEGAMSLDGLGRVDR